MSLPRLGCKKTVASVLDARSWSQMTCFGGKLAATFCEQPCGEAGTVKN